jgi:hypothetical protein
MDFLYTKNADFFDLSMTVWYSSWRCHCQKKETRSCCISDMLGCAIANYTPTSLRSHASCSCCWEFVCVTYFKLVLLKRFTIALVEIWNWEKWPMILGALHFVSSRIQVIAFLDILRNELWLECVGRQLHILKWEHLSLVDLSSLHAVIVL